MVIKYEFGHCSTFRTDTLHEGTTGFYIYLVQYKPN